LHDDTLSEIVFREAEPAVCDCGSGSGGSSNIYLMRDLQDAASGVGVRAAARGAIPFAAPSAFYFG